MVTTKLNNKEIFDPAIMDVYYAYAIGDDDTFNKLTSGNKILKQLVEQHSSWKTNGDLREAIICKVLGWKHNPAINGFDATTDEDHDGEVKTESLRGDGLYYYNIDEWLALQKKLNRSTSSYKLVGRTRWSKCNKDKSRNPKYKNKLELLIGENPKMGVAGFVDGKIAYVVTFDFNDCPKFPKKLKMKSPTTNTEDWASAPSLKLKFINIDFLNKKLMNDKLYYTLKNITEGKISNEWF